MCVERHTLRMLAGVTWATVAFFAWVGFFFNTGDALRNVDESAAAHVRAKWFGVMVILVNMFPPVIAAGALWSGATSRLPDHERKLVLPYTIAGLVLLVHFIAALAAFDINGGVAPAFGWWIMFAALLMCTLDGTIVAHASFLSWKARRADATLYAPVFS